MRIVDYRAPQGERGPEPAGIKTGVGMKVSQRAGEGLGVSETDRPPLRAWPCVVQFAYFSGLCWLLLGCSESGSDAPDGPHTGGSASSSSCPSGPDASDGSGTADGAVQGTPYTSVASARFIGSPDSAATTVVYVFSQPVACQELCGPGWDERIADQTQSLELKMFGTSPGTFTAVRSVTPAPGEASVNYTLTSTTGTPMEVSASSGQVVLDTVNVARSARGSFDLKFGADTLQGTFDAAHCPGGHEP